MFSLYPINIDSVTSETILSDPFLSSNGARKLAPGLQFTVHSIETTLTSSI